jgi:hypothetical protein
MAERTMMENGVEYRYYFAPPKTRTDERLFLAHRAIADVVEHLRAIATESEIVLDAPKAAQRALAAAGVAELETLQQRIYDCYTDFELTEWPRVCGMDGYCPG